MFKKDEEKKPIVDDIETVIGPSVQVEGSFIANGDIAIEGTVSGSIKTERNLRIGKDAKIFANIQAKNAVIAGEVQGNIKVQENLELSSTAKIFGDVKAKILNMAEGANLQGKCLVGDAKKSRQEKINEKEKIEKKAAPKMIDEEVQTIK